MLNNNDVKWNKWTHDGVDLPTVVAQPNKMSQTYTVVYKTIHMLGCAERKTIDVHANRQPQQSHKQIGKMEDLDTYKYTKKI